MMVCWVCNRFTADRGEICHVCKRLAGEDSRTPELRLELRKFAGVLVALLSVAMGLLSPAVVSRPSLPWRHPSKFAALLPATAPVSYQTSMVVQQVKRKVYPYSLVPGGAENVHEAKWAMADPAVKNNYAQFDVAQLKQVKLTTNISGYVSYRWGDKIYWTARRITLRAGETVFTDGVHIVRGRCLNCYSALPMLPIRPHEPSEIAFDTPAELPVTVYSFPKLPVLAPELPGTPRRTHPFRPGSAGRSASNGRQAPRRDLVSAASDYSANSPASRAPSRSPDPGRSPGSTTSCGCPGTTLRLYRGGRILCHNPGPEAEETEVFTRATQRRKRHSIDVA